MATIPRFFYTKVSKDKSPWQKSGFQMVGYSSGFLDKKNILDIESHIHFPGLHFFEEKETYFFVLHQEKANLVWLHTQSLPDELDEFGREGMFMAQGFVIPAEVWEAAQNPFALGETLRKYLRVNYQDLLTAPELNLQTGELTPLEILPDNFNHQLTHPKKDLFLLLDTVLEQVIDNNPLGILIQGSAQQVQDCFSWVGAYLPPTLRSKFSYDTAFDSGKLLFSPFRFAGFSKNKPVTGNPLIFDSNTNLFLQHKTSQPEIKNKLFLNWLNALSEYPLPEKLEYHYQLGRLISGHPNYLSIDKQVDKLFWSANQQHIAKLLIDNNPEIINYLLQTPQNVTVLEKMINVQDITQKRIEKLLPSYFQPIRDRFLNYARIYFSKQPILGLNFDWPELLSNFLSEVSIPYSEYKAVFSDLRAQNISTEKYPLLKLLLNTRPDQSLMAEVPDILRKNWLFFLIEFYEISNKKLIEMGFLKEEISEGEKTTNKGFWYKLKRIFS
ncbi:MAG: hypothetical protein LC115_02290 [Bacteroidia bacterium]|nr:hypothetical protein [Bacteroidia bacterium]